MESKTSRIVIGAISVVIALFLAWRIGLWLEPEPAPKGAEQVATSPAAKEPPFATGKARENLPFELRNVRATAGGTVVEGAGIVKFDLDRDDIKPVAVAMLRLLKVKFPTAKRMVLTLTPSIDCPACGIAEVVYDNGSGLIRYGIPSNKQIEESNAKIGTLTEDGKKIDRPRLARIDRESFNNGYAVTMAITAARKKEPKLTEEQLLDKAAATTGLSYVVARRYRDFMGAYYTGKDYGSETFGVGQH